MTVGEYHNGDQEEYLIPRSAFESRESIGRFVDVAPQSGVNTVSTSGGIIVDAFDNDGLVDIVVSDYDECAPMHFFHNNGDGTFSDRTTQAGLADQLLGFDFI